MSDILKFQQEYCDTTRIKTELEDISTSPPFDIPYVKKETDDDIECEDVKISILEEPCDNNKVKIENQELCGDFNSPNEICFQQAKQNLTKRTISSEGVTDVIDLMKENSKDLEFEQQFEKFEQTYIKSGKSTYSDLNVSQIRQSDVFVIKKSKKLECNKCEKEFPNAGTHQKHMQMHAIIEAHELPINMSADREAEEERKKQWRRQVPNKLHQCDECEKTFLNRVLFRQHKLVHSIVKVHECKICKRKFPERFSYNRHMRMHNSKISTGLMLNMSKTY